MADAMRPAASMPQSFEARRMAATKTLILVTV
jgi:hypothetical protein